MIKAEAKFSIRFRHWLKANPIRLNCWFEMKDTRGNKNFNLKEWKEEQRQFSDSLKYSDNGILVRTEGVKGLPDYKYAYHEPTLVVINFPQGFVLIESETLALQTVKSINFDRAKELAHYVVE